MHMVDIALRGAIFTGLWWVLNMDDPDSWLMGAPLAALATLLSIAILPPSRPHLAPLGLLRFALFFLRKSLVSSVDVAWRVMQPEMPLKPGVVRYPLRVEGEFARVLIANTTSLLPGTLSVDLEEDTLVVHALDVDAPVIDELRHLEQLIAGIFGIQLGGK